MKKMMLLMLTILFTQGSICYCAKDVNTRITGLTSGDTLEVEFICYYKNEYSKYLLTEATFKRYGQSAASVINGNSGVSWSFGNIYCNSNDWGTTLVNGDPVTFIIMKPLTGSVETNRWSYNDMATSIEVISSSTLSSTNYLPMPNTYQGFPGNATSVITWDAVPGADNYYVYRRHYGSSDYDPKCVNGNTYALYQFIGTTETNRYYDTSLKNGDKYFYVLFAQQGGMAKVGAHTPEIMISPSSKSHPVIVSVTPNTGENTGKTIIALKGAGFNTGPKYSARIGKTNLLKVLRSDDNTITAEVPSGIKPGVYDIVVKVKGASSFKSAMDHFTVTGKIKPPIKR